MGQSVQKLRVAAYCRVSTAQEEQLLSYENQVNYYTKFINENPLYEYAGTYADEGISATNTKKRDEFKRMIADCRAGKIDMIITKSISRFARNTLDCLNYVRELKELGIGIIFEKENINTLDAKGEVLLTILSSLAQDESRSISENSTWGIRRRFEKGQHKMSTKRFLGYDTDEEGKLIINRKQAQIVNRLYSEFLNGKTVDYIKRIFEREGVKNWDGGTKWQATTLQSMLDNEKYKGDAILQKSYTTDFLTKKRVQNNGEIQKFYIEDDHEAIIEPWIWECVQLETERRKRYLEEHETKSYSNNTEKNPFASKIVCGECNKVFTRKGWRSSTGETRKIWQCSERYKVKGVMGCANRHIEEDTIQKIYLIAWNKLLECRDILILEWEEKMNSDDLLAKFLAKDFIEVTKEAKPMQELDIGLMLRTLDYIKVYENGIVTTVFLDGTEIEYDTEVIVM
ncbi:recombinase family protein [Lacrimispora sp.]|uniref:recombinase family protein n=1 Tax=Lacrimispora sp. TaxID=2719234 RepID=UPI0028976917|nr:recombinase family protein [Lacrimispora sp.]